MNNSTYESSSHTETKGSTASEYNTTKYLSDVGSSFVNPDCCYIILFSMRNDKDLNIRNNIMRVYIRKNNIRVEC